MKRLCEDVEARNVPLSPRAPFVGVPEDQGAVSRMAAGHARIGGLLEVIAERLSCDLRALLALWHVESGGALPDSGDAPLYVDLDRLWQLWGKQNREDFDRHFRLEGEKSEASLQMQSWRPDPSAPWQSAHVGSREREFRVFDLAAGLAGRETACLATAVGNPAIEGADFADLGYESAASLVDALLASERWRVCAFFDLVVHLKVLKALRELDWAGYARKRATDERPIALVKRCMEAYQAADELNDYPRHGFDIRDRRKEANLFSLNPALAQSVRLLSGPESPSVLAVLGEGAPIRRLEVHQRLSDWWRVEAEIEGARAQGWLRNDCLQAAPPLEEHWPERGLLPSAHLSRQDHGRSTASGRCFPINEASMPARNATEEAEKCRQLSRIVRYLDPGNPEHLRYRTGEGTSQAETYAYDFCCLARVYLARVWWNDRALLALGAGQLPHVIFGTTVRELGANQLFEWFVEFGPDYGWQRHFAVEELQEAANRGEVAVILAQSRNLDASGHIGVVVPEEEGSQAVREEGRVTRPVESQAGPEPVTAGTASDAWWLGERYRDFAFWVHG